MSDDAHIINIVKRLIENESVIQNQKIAFLEAKSYSQEQDMVELKNIVGNMKTKLDDHVELNNKMSDKDEDFHQASSPNDLKSVAFHINQKNRRAARLIPVTLLRYGMILPYATNYYSITYYCTGIKMKSRNLIMENCHPAVTI